MQQYICEQIYLLFGNICQGTNICLTCLNTYSSKRRGASQNIKKLNVQEIGRFSFLRLLSRASCLMSIDGCISINPHTYLGKRMASKALALMRGTTSRCHLKTNEKQIKNNTKTQIWVTKSQQYYNGPIANAIHLYVVHTISNTSANPEQPSRQNINKNPCWASIGCNEYGRGAAASSVDQVLHLRII